MAVSSAENTYQEVRAFVATALRRRPDLITGNTALFHDLALYGDDTDDFFGAFRSRFDVNLDCFEEERYFPNEGYFNFRPIALIRWLLRRHISDPEYKRLTVNDLVRAVRSKVLVGSYEVIAPGGQDDRSRVIDEHP